MVVCTLSLDLKQDRTGILFLLHVHAEHVSSTRYFELVNEGGEFVMPSHTAALALKKALWFVGALCLIRELSEEL